MSSTLATTARTAGTVAATNSVLADLVDALNTYPKTYLTVEIYDVDPVGTGSAINEDDEVTFRVRVHNAGPLNVDNLTVLVEAEPAAQGVRLHGAAAFTPSLTSATFPRIKGHQKADEWTDTPDDHYHFKAGAATSTAVDLVKVSINTWDGNTDHIFDAHSDPSPDTNDFVHAKVVRI